jgi:uncharacterized membrane protein
MGGPHRPDLLGSGIAAVLRIGTLAAMAAVAVGYLVLLASGDEPAAQPLLELLEGGGGGAVIGIGLLALTLLPAAVLAVAALGFHRRGERRYALVTLGVLGLLGAGLVAGALVTAS